MSQSLMAPVRPGISSAQHLSNQGTSAQQHLKPKLRSVIPQKRLHARSIRQRRLDAVATELANTNVGGGSGGSGDDIPGGGNGGGDRGGDSDGSAGGNGGVEALLLAAGKSLDQLPAAIQDAIKRGTISREALQKYLSYESSNGFLRTLLRISGFRDRILGDDGFLAKVAIELGIGLFCKVAAEKTKRGKAFKSQIDFVAANVVMALIADFMLVWLSAPRLQLSRTAISPKVGNAVSKFFAGCPDNAFQVLPAGAQPWSLAQRTAAIVRNGTKLLGVGFGASMFGVTMTNGIIAVRSKLDSSFSSPNPPQDVVRMSGGYAAYMASSSNLRYQVVAGVIEERFIEVLVQNQLLRTVLSFGVRTGNTFVGSLLWVDFLRLVGLQKKE